MKHYKTAACLSCNSFEKCTKNKAGRLIERTEHAALIEANKKRVEQNKELYRRGQAIVEHPYGIIKRQWGFYYIMTKKSIKHASADVGLIFTAFNLRRIFNILDKNVLKKYLKVLALFLLLIKDYFKQFCALVFLCEMQLRRRSSCFFMCYNRLYLTHDKLVFKN